MYDVVISFPNVDKSLGLLLSEKGIDVEYSRKGVPRVKLKDKKKLGVFSTVYTIPKELMEYKEYFKSSVNLLETSGKNFAQVICTLDGYRIAPYYTKGKNAFFGIKVRAAIVCATKDRNDMTFSVDVVKIKREGDTIIVDEITICEETRDIPNEFVEAAAAASSKYRNPDFHFIKARKQI